MKSKNRIHHFYREGTQDWDAEFNMLLDDGVTCNDCVSCKRCVAMFGVESTNTTCDFYPNRFTEKEKEV